MVFTRVERASESAAARLERLLALPYSSPRSARAAAIELAIRLWARRDKTAAKAVRHIDRTRLDYFEKLLREHGVPADKVRDRAFLFYASLMAEAFIVDNRAGAERQLATTLLSSD
jgi:hypothetical protein